MASKKERNARLDGNGPRRVTQSAHFSLIESDTGKVQALKKYMNF
jgi:hypothetical protein